MRRHAFTLLEVIIAAIIISFMSIGILQLESSTTHNLTILEQQTAMDQLASSLLSQPDSKLHNKDQDLYTFLKDKYTIDYAPLIDFLKKEKLHFSQKEVSMIQIDLAKQRALQQGSLDSNVPKLKLMIQSNKLQKAHQSAQTLSFGVIP